MKLRNFRPSYPSDGGLGYRLGRDLWAECLDHDETDTGEVLTYLVYTGALVGMPSVDDLHRLVALIERQGQVVVVTGEQALVDHHTRRQARLVRLDCRPSGVPGA